MQQQYQFMPQQFMPQPGFNGFNPQVMYGNPYMIPQMQPAQPQAMPQQQVVNQKYVTDKNGMPIKVSAKEISDYILLELYVATAEKENNRTGRKENYCYVVLRDNEDPSSRNIGFVTFNLPDLWEAAQPYKTETNVTHRGTLVNLKEMATAKVPAFLQFQHWYGFIYKAMPLRKGLCYGKDQLTGKRLVDRDGNEVKRDSIHCIGKAKYAYVRTDGSYEYVWADGWDINDDLHDKETRMWNEPVDPTADSQMPSANENSAAVNPFTAQPPRPQVAQPQPEPVAPQPATAQPQPATASIAGATPQASDLPY